MICFNCFTTCSPGTGDKKFNGCSRCKAAWYCGKGCQVEHWKKSHKNICGGYKIKEWSRKDALEKTLDPFCIGLDPPQKDDQLSYYYLHLSDIHGASIQQDRLDPNRAREEAEADMRSRRGI